MAIAPNCLLGIDHAEKRIIRVRIAGIVKPQYFPQMASFILGLFTDPITRDKALSGHIDFTFHKAAP